jgi:hypothetical protein
MSRIFLTGDMHGELGYKRFSSKNWSAGKLLSSNDFLIVLGDFGILWDLHESKTELYLKKWFNNKPWTTLFIDGNHENFERLNKLETTAFLGGKVGIVTNSIFHLKRGEIYTINNKTFLCIGGAKSYDKHLRMENISWWKEEELNFSEQQHVMEQLENHKYTVDNILAHTLPETVTKQFGYTLSGHSDSCSVRKFLDYIIQTTKFQNLWCGHWHDERNSGKFHVLYNNIVEIT